MRKLILVALILQLVITIDTNFQFGDIISFKPRCITFKEKNFRYQHFAIYVGDEDFPNKSKEKNIYERQKQLSSCGFSTLDNNEEPQVTNYLDGYKGKNGQEYKAGTKQQIIERINQFQNRCSPYGVISNNCEHLATYVRYGVKVALQFNMTGENRCFNNQLIQRINTKDMIKYVREVTECPNEPSSSNG